MTTGGFIIMTVSVTGVTIFFGWTLYMVFLKKDTGHKMHSTLDETPDVDDDL
jgi:hypothetical protein